jgi:hypothetical protein
MKGTGLKETGMETVLYGLGIECKIKHKLFKYKLKIYPAKLQNLSMLSLMTRSTWCGVWSQQYP